MSLLFRKTEPGTEARNLTQQILRQISAAQPMSPTFVDGETAMRHDAVWSCRTRIAQDVSMMPADVVRYVNGTRQEVTPTPRIIAAPSAVIPAMDWRYQVVDSWLGWGNAWGIVTQTTPDQLYPTRIELQSPASVRWQTIDGTLRFFVNNVEHQLWPVGDLWHVPAYTLPGSPIGMSPIQFHRMTISTGLQAQQFGAEFFPNGHPTAILSVDEPTLTQEQASGIKARLMEIVGGGKREPLVMPGTHTYTPITVNPEDSQFIETMRYSVEQICRIFGEDPADHGASAGGTAVTYANRSDADLARLKRRQFWVTKLQNALTDLLPRPQVVKLNTSVSLMMTARERHELHKLRLDSHTVTVNEVRRIEDEEPFPGDEFDTPGIPTPAAPAAPAARALEGRSEETRVQQPHATHIHLPDNLQVEMRQEPIVVPAPVVNIPPAEITVNVEPTPVTVNVEAPNVDVNVPAPVVNVDAPNIELPAPVVHVVQQKGTARVVRDGDGNITKVVAE